MIIGLLNFSFISPFGILCWAILTGTSAFLALLLFLSFSVVSIASALLQETPLDLLGLR